MATGVNFLPFGSLNWSTNAVSDAVQRQKSRQERQDAVVSAPTPGSTETPKKPSFRDMLGADGLTDGQREEVNNMPEVSMPGEPGMGLVPQQNPREMLRNKYLHENQDALDNEAAADANQQRQTLSQLQQQAQSMVNDYKTGLPERQSKMKGILAGQIRQNMNADQSKTEGDFARRGLLNSGGLLSRMKAMQAKSASAYAKGAQDIEDQTNNEAFDLQDKVNQMGIDVAGKDLSASQSYYQNALENLQRRNQSLSDAGSALGSLAGRLYAGQDSSGGGNTNYQSPVQGSIYSQPSYQMNTGYGGPVNGQPGLLGRNQNNPYSFFNKTGGK